MKVRRHLRPWAAVLLVLQSAWLLAIVPADCCAAHATAAAERSCHEEVRATPCPMMDSTGAACPMHSTDQPHQSGSDCRMTGGCKGPMSALLSLLSMHAVLSAASLGLATPPAPAPERGPREQVTSRFIPPDAPPPRA